MFKKTLLTTAIMAFSLNANAALTIYSNSGPGSDSDSFEKGYQFYQKGLSGNRDYEPEGYGRGMPLDMAMSIIVPEGWGEVNFKDKAGELPVNWSGGRAWDEVLKDLAEKNDLIVTVDWNNKTIDVVSSELESEKLNRLEKELALAKKMEEEKTKVVKNQKEETDVKGRELFKEELDALKEKQKNAMEEIAKEEKRLEKIKEQYNTATVLPGDGTFEEYLQLVDSGEKITTRDEATFIINSEKSLKENLKVWADQVENWIFVDNTASKKDFYFPSNVVIKGKFIGVTSDLISKYERSDFPLDVAYHVEKGNVYTIELKRFNYNF